MYLSAFKKKKEFCQLTEDKIQVKMKGMTMNLKKGRKHEYPKHA